MKAKPRRIVVYGCAGSGKTTLALKLHALLGLPLYHLDQYYWKPNWQRPDIDEFQAAHDDLCDTDAWILEGAYTSVLPYRLQCADMIIFLDLPRWRCLWQVLKRLWYNNGKQTVSTPAGCYERLDWELLKWVWEYKKRSRKFALWWIELYGADKQVHILRSHHEIAEFIKKLDTGTDI